MSAKIFGIIGDRCHDLVYYAAKTASSLGFKTTMIDLSNDHNLTYLYKGSITPGDIVNVNGVDLISEKLERGCLANYEYVFIYYGLNPVLLELCHEFYFVTDLFKDTISKLKEITIPDVPRYLIIRNRAACSINSKAVLADLKNLDIADDEVYEIDDTDDDVRSAVYLQYSMNVKFNKLSAGIKEFVVHVLETDSSHKEIDRAWRALMKG